MNRVPSRREVARAAIAAIRAEHGFVSRLARDEQGFLVTKIDTGPDPAEPVDEDEIF
jgi:YD repeat-containing protein